MAMTRLDSIRSTEWRHVPRRGRSADRREGFTLIRHEDEVLSRKQGIADDQLIVGLVVNKKGRNAVQQNRLTRQLRAALRAQDGAHGVWVLVAAKDLDQLIAAHGHAWLVSELGVAISRCSRP